MAVRCHRYTVMAIEPTAMTAAQGRGRASQADTRARASITSATWKTASRDRPNPDQLNGLTPARSRW